MPSTTDLASLNKTKLPLGDFAKRFYKDATPFGPVFSYYAAAVPFALIRLAAGILLNAACPTMCNPRDTATMNTHAGGRCTNREGRGPASAALARRLLTASHDMGRGSTPDATVNHGRDTTRLARCARLARVTMRPFGHRTRPSATERHIDASWRQMLAPRSPSTSDPNLGIDECGLVSKSRSAPAPFARVSRA